MRWVAMALCFTALGCGRIGYEVVTINIDADGGVTDTHDIDTPDGRGTGVDARAVDTLETHDVPEAEDSQPPDAPEPSSQPDGAALDAGTDNATKTDAGTNDAMVGPVDPATVGYCAQIPAMAAPPVVDGVLDPGLTLLPFTPHFWSGNGAMPDAVSATYAAAWRPDGLYVFITVQDPNLIPFQGTNGSYCGDSVEVYVDNDGVFSNTPDYDDPGSIQLIAAAPEEGGGPRSVGHRYRPHMRVGTWTSPNYVTVQTANGYAAEIFVTAADLDLTEWTLSAGMRVGFNMAHNVSFAMPVPGLCHVNRAGQYFLRVNQPRLSYLDDPFMDISTFCRPELLAP